jgi:hypothetical protein
MFYFYHSRGFRSGPIQLTLPRNGPGVGILFFRENRMNGDPRTYPPIQNINVTAQHDYPNTTLAARLEFPRSPSTPNSTN